MRLQATALLLLCTLLSLAAADPIVSNLPSHSHPSPPNILSNTPLQLIARQMSSTTSSSTPSVSSGSVVAGEGGSSGGTGGSAGGEGVGAGGGTVGTTSSKSNPAPKATGGWAVGVGAGAVGIVIGLL